MCVNLVGMQHFTPSGTPSGKVVTAAFLGDYNISAGKTGKRKESNREDL